MCLSCSVPQGVTIQCTLGKAVLPQDLKQDDLHQFNA